MALNCSIGSAPLNLLLSTLKYATFFHADIEAGRLPVRELSPTPKVSMSTNAFTDSATVPLRLHWNSSLRRQGGGGQRRGGGSARVCRQARRQRGTRQRLGALTFG